MGKVRVSHQSLVPIKLKHCQPKKTSQSSRPGIHLLWPLGNDELKVGLADATVRGYVIDLSANSYRLGSVLRTLDVIIDLLLTAFWGWVLAVVWIRQRDWSRR